MLALHKGGLGQLEMRHCVFLLVLNGIEMKILFFRWKVCYFGLWASIPSLHRTYKRRWLLMFVLNSIFPTWLVVFGWVQYESGKCDVELVNVNSIASRITTRNTSIFVHMLKTVCGIFLSKSELGNWMSRKGKWTYFADFW